jgi:transposase
MRSSTAPLCASTSTPPGQGGTQAQAIGRSRGGLPTRIVALVDALGNLVRFILLPGQRHDSLGVAPLITDLDFAALLADKAFDVHWLRAELDKRGVQAVIPPKANRGQPVACDFHMYRWRHLVENFFRTLKAFRRIATRHDKFSDARIARDLGVTRAAMGKWHAACSNRMTTGCSSTATRRSKAWPNLHRR